MLTIHVVTVKSQVRPHKIPSTGTARASPEIWIICSSGFPARSDVLSYNLIQISYYSYFYYLSISFVKDRTRPPSFVKQTRHYRTTSIDYVALRYILSIKHHKSSKYFHHQVWVSILRLSLGLLHTNLKPSIAPGVESDINLFELNYRKNTQILSDDQTVHVPRILNGCITEYDGYNMNCLTYS